MIKYIFGILGLILISITGYTQSSSQTQISLITCGPDYEDPSAMFGHTAIRLYDPTRNIDRIYNYGLFDMSDKWQFVKDFVTGNTQYAVGSQDYRRFLEIYNYYGRWIREQSLDLTPNQKIAIEEFLNNNIKPENREYLYQFFYDNCSTRVKDLFEDFLPRYDYVDSPDQMRTYRQLINEYAVGMDWTDFGIDIIIGSPGDEIIDHHGQMFLPDYLMTYMDRFQSPEGKKLVTETRDVLLHPAQRPASFWITPAVLFSILLLLEFIVFLQFRNKKSKWIKTYDWIWYAVISLAAALLLFMLTTLHYPCHYNYNLLWLNPLFILLIILKFIGSDKLKNGLQLGLITILVITIGAWTLFPQDMPNIGIVIAVISILKLTRAMKNDSPSPAIG